MLDKAIAKLIEKGYEQVGDFTKVPHPTNLSCYLGYIRRVTKHAESISLRSEQSAIHPVMIRECEDAEGRFWIAQTLLTGDNFSL